MLGAAMACKVKNSFFAKPRGIEVNCCDHQFIFLGFGHREYFAVGIDDAAFTLKVMPIFVARFGSGHNKRGILICHRLQTQTIEKFSHVASFRRHLRIRRWRIIS